MQMGDVDDACADIDVDDADVHVADADVDVCVEMCMHIQLLDCIILFCFCDVNIGRGTTRM
jgi:hypothetical protein